MTFSPTLDPNAAAKTRSDTDESMDGLASSLEDKEPPTQQTAVQVTPSVPEATPPVLRSTSDVKPSPPRVQGVASTECELCPAKRLHVSSSSSESSQTGSFVISKSTKSRGRPQVRKKQGNAEKKQRIERGKQKATKLIQGTLAPVPNLRNIVKLLDNDYSYGDAKQLLPNLSIRAVPKTKKAIAGIYTPAECNSNIRFVFPKQFVEKCQAAMRAFCKSMVGTCEEDGVGVRVPRFGIFQHRGIVAMNRGHTSMEYLSETEEAINWAINTSTKRISIPDHFAGGVQSDPLERENAIKMILLKGGPETSFGNVPYRSLLTLSENRWMDDNCMAHGIALLQREHANVGVVNPVFSRFEKRETQLNAINAGNPFQETNKIILLPLHVDNNHWCGTVFDYRRESR